MSNNNENIKPNNDIKNELSERVKMFLRPKIMYEPLELNEKFDSFNLEEQETILNNLQSYNFIRINSEKIEYIPDNLMNLEILEIVECPNIKEIPKNLPKLRCLKIFFGIVEFMDEKENLIKEIPKSLNNLKVLDLHFTLNKIEIPETVEQLTLMNCPNIEINNLPNLKRLHITNPELKEIPKSLTNLTYLYVDMCKNLKEIPETLTNLEELHIRGYNNIKEIPETLTNLKELHIIGYNNIKEIPETLINLRVIDTYNCGDLIIPDKIKDNIKYNSYFTMF